MSDDLSSAEGVPPSPKAEGLGPALVSGAAPLDCVCPNCGEDLAIDGKDHIPGCSYILSPSEENMLDKLLELAMEVDLPDE